MDRLTAFSRVIVSSTQELCDKLLSTYIDTLKETCKNGTSQTPHSPISLLMPLSMTPATCLCQTCNQTESLLLPLFQRHTL